MTYLVISYLGDNISILGNVIIEDTFVASLSVDQLGHVDTSVEKVLDASSIVAVLRYLAENT